MFLEIGLDRKIGIRYKIARAFVPDGTGTIPPGKKNLVASIQNGKQILNSCRHFHAVHNFSYLLPDAFSAMRMR